MDAIINRLIIFIGTIAGFLGLVIAGLVIPVALFFIGLVIFLGLLACGLALICVGILGLINPEIVEKIMSEMD